MQEDAGKDPCLCRAQQQAQNAEAGWLLNEGHGAEISPQVGMTRALQIRASNLSSARLEGEGQVRRFHGDPERVEAIPRKPAVIR